MPDAIVAAEGPVVSHLLPAPIHSLPGRHRPFPVSPRLRRLLDAILAAGGRPVVVGGSIRDHLLGLPEKDIDIEVFGLALTDLEQALLPFEVHAVGRSFGVLKVNVEEGGDKEGFDVALPRRESKVGRGHKGFVVESDPSMSFADAAGRRDFTLNAIGLDVAAGPDSWLDPHEGMRDLEAGVLRHVSDAFDEDPLRVLRAAQFAARFGLAVDETTIDRCGRLQSELPTLAAERTGEELKKLLLKGVWPSLGLQVLRKTGALVALFPELNALIGCPQEAEWHPEGDVWIHTMMVVDEAARLCRQRRLDDEERLRVMLGALAHDLGKPGTTEFVDGRIRSRDHEAAGEPPTRALLARMALPPDLIEDVVALVREHLKPFMLWKDRDKIGDGAIRRLALRVPLQRLVLVAQADHFGRTTDDALVRDDPAGPWLLAEAARLHVEDQAPRPLLLGRHLQALGLKPGKRFGVLLKEAFDAQLEGVFADELGGVQWLKERMDNAGGDEG